MLRLRLCVVYDRMRLQVMSCSAYGAACIGLALPCSSGTACMAARRQLQEQMMHVAHLWAGQTFVEGTGVAARQSTQHDLCACVGDLSKLLDI